MSSLAVVPQEVHRFSAEVGPNDPVTVVGGRTQWNVGGPPDPSAREVTAPAGIWSHEPEEMTVRCGAGTTLLELSEQLARHRQMVPFDMAPNATVGGVLSVGMSGIRRLRYGHIRDLVLQIRHIDCNGKIVTSGGPTVKNVSGYDLCRLMVGSLGKLGCLAEVILRCLPMPETTRWLTGNVDPFEVYSRLYRPSSVLWNGEQVWVCIEGVSSDVEAEAGLLDLSEVEGPPSLPSDGRISVEPKELKNLSVDDTNWIAEIGVGIIHSDKPSKVRQVSEINESLMRDLERRLDPEGRLNPGRQVVPL
ncbi:MAG: FAD-binding protein [Actinomycetota bacterium]|nr:FAD-binding protein [Actinomycetota bacterium]MEE3257405.1 FAD-binding protein [Actinomycetota bacterium]